MHKNEGRFLLKTKTKNKIKLASWNYTEEKKKRQNIGLMVAINLAQLKTELCCEKKKKKNRETNTTHATTNCHSQNPHMSSNYICFIQERLMREETAAWVLVTRVMERLKGVMLELSI